MGEKNLSMTYTNVLLYYNLYSRIYKIVVSTFTRAVLIYSKSQYKHWIKISVNNWRTCLIENRYVF